MTGNQRWAERRDSYRVPSERIVPREYDVAAIVDDGTARGFVERHHYSRSYPAARVRVGLYRRCELVGVAVFSHPCNDRVLTSAFPALSPLESIELGRFVLLDEVPGNGETWFLARCFELLRARGLQGVVSFSDPVERTSADGRLVFPGHVGTIYQAHNARYLGRGTPDLLRVLPDGTVLSPRTQQKIRAGERGWRAAVELLGRYGADVIADGAPRADRLEWLTTWLPRLTRRVRHPGNHKYAWSLSRRLRLASGLAYPKVAA